MGEVQEVTIERSLTKISLGDVFLAVGLGAFLEYELRRPRRYFKRGARAETGSANRPETS